MRSFVFLLFFALSPLTAAAQATPSNQAPFGLSWGMSAAEVRTLGAELTDMPGTEWGTSFRAAKLPKMLSDAEFVVLSFGYDDKLWRIAAASRSFENDPTGTNVLARYEELSGILADKYGKGKTAHYLGQYNSQQYFAMHIKGGDAQWFTNFNAPQMTIQLAIGARDYSTTFWRLIFEETALAVEFEKAKKGRREGRALSEQRACWRVD